MNLGVNYKLLYKERDELSNKDLKIRENRSKNTAELRYYLNGVKNSTCLEFHYKINKNLVNWGLIPF